MHGLGACTGKAQEQGVSAKHQAFGFRLKTYVKGGLCDAPISGGPLTTRQPSEYSWMSGNLPDIHENRIKSHLYGEFYPNTSPVI